MSEPLLTIADLEIRYGSGVGVGPVDLAVYDREIFGIVGESGSGKTTLGMGILGSLPVPGKIVRGSIRFLGEELVDARPAAWRDIRWLKLAYVPQGAMNVLNPVTRIGSQFGDIVRDHTGSGLSGGWLQRVQASLEAVRLPVEVLAQYQHELSGGMKQRVCIAMAIMFNPKLIVADESTSALDVVSQRVVLQTLMRVRSEFQTSIILIGHDIALQAQVADRIGIMFAGHFVEVGSVADVFDDPRHPYTQRLIASVPSIRLRQGIPDVPLPSDAERQSWRNAKIPLLEVTAGHFVRPLDEVVMA